MTLHIYLPIYRTASDLASLTVDYVRNMPRDVKGVVGNRVREVCFESVLLIMRANSAQDKRPHLTALLERIEEAQLIFRFCVEKRFISHDQYARTVKLTTSVGKQANKWRGKYATSSVT